MGLFDEVVCEMPLPGDVPSFVNKCPVFQTYDLGKCMNVFKITKEGSLVIARSAITEILKNTLGITADSPDLPIKYKRKRIEMHATNMCGGGPHESGYRYYTEDGSDCIDIGYIVQIRSGQVSSIKEAYRDTKNGYKYPRNR